MYTPNNHFNNLHGGHMVRKTKFEMYTCTCTYICWLLWEYDTFCI